LPRCPPGSVTFIDGLEYALESMQMKAAVEDIIRRLIELVKEIEEGET
jgi:hypothetical protein